MVLKIVEKVMESCCGGNTVTNAQQMPWKKPAKEEEQIPETKNNGIKVPAKKAQKKGFTDKEMKFELTVWKDLPLNARKAAKELGYDQTKWDNSEHLHIEHKHWRDLTEAELKAVQTLGWEEEAWEHQYEHHEFKDLPELQKKAAAVVGLTEDNWHHWPKELEHKHWNDMTETEKQALAVFGWNKSEWD